MKPIGLVLLLAALAVRPVFALDSVDAERAQIRAARDAAEATYKRKQAECAARFVVTSCVEDARREQRETLSKLRHRETELSDAERKERTAERRQEIADNAKRDRERQKEASVPEKRDQLRQQSEPRVTVRPAPRPSSRAASGSLGVGMSSERPVDEAKNRADFEARQKAAAEHREAVEQRNLERTQKGKIAAPLPTPPASAP
jgi:hypothetical protein